MDDTRTSFLRGLHDGFPICLGYFSVAFAFGIFAVSSGLDVMQAVLISMANTTSAGQMAAVPLLAGGGSLLELGLTQLVINLRYSLMSVSLSQKLDPAVRLCDRFVVAFVNTDEVFAVASSRPGTLTAPYMYGLILTPYVGWSFGTLIGALAGNILPAALVSALGIAIYGMFLAIVIPAAKQSRATLFCVLFAVGLGCMFRYVPVLAQVSEGFVMILCAVVASAVFALLAPVPEGEVTDS